MEVRGPDIKQYIKDTVDHQVSGYKGFISIIKDHYIRYILCTAYTSSTYPQANHNICGLLLADFLLKYYLYHKNKGNAIHLDHQ